MNFLRKAEFNFWRFAEARSLLEIQSFYLLRPLMNRLPKSDGHPVLVLPGFMASDVSTAPLRGLLADLGYKTYGWGLGRNIIVDRHREADLQQLLRAIHEKHGQKVSVIGWSLGGLFAREIAKVHPECVRTVITLGSPISGQPKHSNVNRLFGFFNRARSAEHTERRKELNQAPPVPTTSIFSKSDGIVAWEGSLQHDGAELENIRVPASHIGMGANPLVMYVIAERLAQAEGEWQRFNPSPLEKLIFSRVRNRRADTRPGFA
ncbi:MAG: alpha/beta hydrolase [Pseudomonadota bacterium]